MPEQYLEIGKITNTHGVMGEVRVQPWADSPDFLCKFKTLYVDKTHWPIKVERARVHKNMVILKLEGVTDVPGALAMRNAILYIDRADVKLPEGSFFLADIMDLNAVEKVQASFFPTYQPARTVAAVDALPQDALVFIEALVDNGEGTQSVPQAGDLVKLTNNTHAAPYDAGSTQTVAFSHYNNITMQLPLDPGTGRPILGDVAAQTAQCLANVKAILTSVDVPFDDIVKVTIFVKNLADANVVDDVYKTFFPDSGIARAVNYLPARTVVPVKDLPYHCDVAVEAVVSHGDGTPPQAIEDRHGLIIEACNTDAAPKCPLATQSVAFSHYNNISAQLPLDLSGKLIDGTVAEQTAQCLAYVKAIVESVDHAVEDIVKVNVYLADIADLAAMNEAYAAFFGDHKPARKVVGCGELPFGARVMIDAIAGNWEGTPPVA